MEVFDLDTYQAVLEFELDGTKKWIGVNGGK